MKRIGNSLSCLRTLLCPITGRGGPLRLAKVNVFRDPTAGAQYGTRELLTLRVARTVRKGTKVPASMGGGRVESIRRFRRPR